jgi:hypothetical protein
MRPSSVSRSASSSTRSSRDSSEASSKAAWPPRQSGRQQRLQAQQEVAQRRLLALEADAQAVGGQQRARIEHRLERGQAAVQLGEGPFQRPPRLFAGALGLGVLAVKFGVLHAVQPHAPGLFGRGQIFLAGQPAVQEERLDGAAARGLHRESGDPVGLHRPGRALHEDQQRLRALRLRRQERPQDARRVGLGLQHAVRVLEVVERQPLRSGEPAALDERAGVRRDLGLDRHRLAARRQRGVQRRIRPRLGERRGRGGE